MVVLMNGPGEKRSIYFSPIEGRICPGQAVLDLICASDAVTGVHEFVRTMDQHGGGITRVYSVETPDGTGGLYLVFQIPTQDLSLISQFLRPESAIVRLDEDGGNYNLVMVANTTLPADVLEEFNRLLGTQEFFKVRLVQELECGSHVVWQGDIDRIKKAFILDIPIAGRAAMVF